MTLQPLLRKFSTQCWVIRPKCWLVTSTC
jgi:hypothetical protein